ncbi:murein transglycosylase [Cladophialophora psammophila CBS 110553]|uniref:Murein transglycosylase n=1 Tax=Cladophialophora psammophila CBS 110553 TaxID=1182543 RepID=W9WKV1_9EURO|nr:murein transglycosylase [Cladophialophora psammophila CBS 110553]EXJ68777.1 murein transglycosylase [Cladophialophora psammophila CBS 110553]
MNPIIPGFAPDPSIVLVDDTYYLVNSSFHIFPGLPIYASKDLVSWRHITNAFNRREQLSLKASETKHSPPGEWGEVMSATGGLYAPTIRYRGGTFYVICTNIIRGEGDNEGESKQNFIITTTDIYSHTWSDPVFFDFDGIDTSLVWDDEGKAYLHGSAAPGPMTTIKMFEIDVKTGSKLSGEELIWRGTGGIWPEGPHIYRKDDWWYLVISEGGTFEDHMITVARSKNLYGPYEPNPHNPILTACGTHEYIQHTGHCDIFCDKQGQWWCVCLGVRKDPKKRYIMGRETFITPGTWPEGDWPTLQPVKMAPEAAYGRKVGKPSALSSEPLVDFCYIRDVNLRKHKISPDGRTIELISSRADLSDARGQVSFVGKRQRVLDGRSYVVLLAPPRGVTGKTGLAIYKDEFRYARIYHDSPTSEMVLEVVNGPKEIRRLTRKECPAGKANELQLEYREDSYRFSFSTVGGSTEFDPFDMMDLVGPDFTGPVIGVFLTSLEDGTSVIFKDLRVE